MNGNDFRTRRVSPELILPRLETIIGTDTFVKGSTEEMELLEAKAGFVNPINNLAAIYSQGLHWMPPNFSKTKQLFELAAEFGNPAAAWNLAGHYQTGDGWDQDLNQAKYWYERARDLDSRPEKKAKIEAKLAEIDKELAAESKAETGQAAEDPRKKFQSSHGSVARAQISDVDSAPFAAAALHHEAGNSSNVSKP
ncbi:MAG: hypothetical protein K0S29_898 [Gammaproteobacteria bacterium]|nr:hypothetical protein [Gammaproteobacteria bacterium]